MTPEQEALGRRAVACPGWKWLRGCPWERPPSGAPDDGGDRGIADGVTSPPDGALPDLSEPAAVGCVVALAKVGLGLPDAHAVRYETYAQHCVGADLEPAIWWALALGQCSEVTWVREPETGNEWCLGAPSEIEVWVAALEAAGRRE